MYINYIPTTTSSGILNYKEEDLSGQIDGSTTAFSLSILPSDNTFRLYWNGVRLKGGAGNDYTISGANITTLFVPYIGNSLMAEYYY